MDGFKIALRGYDRAQVDQLIGAAESAQASGDATRRTEARQALEHAALTVTLRGYNRPAVDLALEQLKAKLAGPAPQ